LVTPGKSRNDSFVIFLSFALVAGMVVAVLVLLLWMKHPASVANGAALRLAIAFCPPFMLVQVVGGTNDTTMGLVISSGAIVVGNASLYAGLASFVYWAMTTYWQRGSGRRVP
jgi:hypothetical protein